MRACQLVIASATMKRFGICVATALLLSSVGCGAVYPELKTPVRPAPPGALSPPPPEDLVFIRFSRAEIPPTTRDGRKWDSVGGDAPDPFAKVFVDDKELFRTPVQSNTLTPTWPDAERANYRVPKGSRIRVELWDSNALNHQPICMRKISNLHNQVSSEALELTCDSGAKILMRVEPAHAVMGLGFLYELRTLDVYVTRVAKESPANRVGLLPGDQLVKIQGKVARDMQEGEAKSLINTHSRTGLNLTVKHPDGSVADLTLKEGPIYPMRSDDIAIP